MLFAKLIKDKKIRKTFLFSETKTKIKKFILINLIGHCFRLSRQQKRRIYSLLLHSFNRKKIFTNFSKKTSSKVKINYRCVLTNRPKSVYKPYGLSRSIFKELLEFGIIPGYKKAVW